MIATDLLSEIEGLLQQNVSITYNNGNFYFYGSDARLYNKGNRLFPLIMDYLGIKTTASLLDSSPNNRSAIILARKVDLYNY